MSLKILVTAALYIGAITGGSFVLAQQNLTFTVGEALSLTGFNLKHDGQYTVGKEKRPCSNLFKSFHYSVENENFKTAWRYCVDEKSFKELADEQGLIIIGTQNGEPHQEYEGSWANKLSNNNTNFEIDWQNYKGEDVALPDQKYDSPTSPLNTKAWKALYDENGGEDVVGYPSSGSVDPIPPSQLERAIEWELWAFDDPIDRYNYLFNTVLLMNTKEGVAALKNECKDLKEKKHNIDNFKHSWHFFVKYCTRVAPKA